MTESMNVTTTRTGRHPLVRALAALLCVQFLLFTTGCSFFASGRQTLSVSSDPPGAKVTINGMPAGMTPLQTTINRKENTQVVVSKPGYQTISRETTGSLSTVGIVDVVGGVIWLVPFLGLIGDGAWKQEPNNIFVVLPQDGQ